MRSATILTEIYIELSFFGRDFGEKILILVPKLANEIYGDAIGNSGAV